MGESIVESPNIETKMGESVASHPSLEVSISFGRFENDHSLSWEKWSSFSPNKYLEEVEKCSTPGSVAQKKAYFEAHYKKIAARKIEILEQENQMGTDPSRSNDLNSQDHTENTRGTDAEFSLSGGQISTEQVEQETHSIDAVSSTVLDEPKEDAASSLICNSLLVDPSRSDDFNCKDCTGNVCGTDAEVCMFSGQSSSEQVEQDTKSINAVSSMILDEPKSVVCEGNAELNGKSETLEFDVPEEAALDKEETPLMGSEDDVKETPKLNRKTKKKTESKEKILKLDERNISQKITPTRKEPNLVGTSKKNPVSPTPKPPQISNLRVQKPAPTSMMTPSSLSSTKKANVSSLQRSKNSSVGKRVAATSLHMSISLGSVNSDSVNTTRSSLIMEKMGDKDIVKRAFKSFQKRLNQQTSSSNEKSCEPKQMATREAEQKVSASTTSRKLNERTRKSTEKIIAQRGQLGTTWNSTSSRSPKEASLDGGNVKAASLAIGLKTDERTEKREEFFKKSEEKLHAKESERTRLSSKALDEKEAEIRKLRQSLNFKAKPMPDFYRGRRISKTPSEKV
ncbi:hypothetical protein LguiB_016163 [Lonicera macranthoides]